MKCFVRNFIRSEKQAIEQEKFTNRNLACQKDTNVYVSTNTWECLLFQRKHKQEVLILFELVNHL